MNTYEELNKTAESIRKALDDLKFTLDPLVTAEFIRPAGSLTSVSPIEQLTAFEHAINGVLDEAYEDMPLLERMKSPDAGKIKLHLFHGRENPDEKMDDWGEDGPTLYCQWIHIVYMSEIELGIEGDADHGLTRDDGLYFHNGMIAVKQGEKIMYYGDWEIVVSQRS